MDEVTEDLSRCGRVIYYVVTGGGHMLTNGDVLLARVQYAVVTDSGQPFQQGNEVVRGHLVWHGTHSTENRGT